jgi:hypothetical protein
MKPRTLILLVVAAVILVAVAIKTSRKNEPLSPDGSSALLLPDFPVNSVSKLVITSNEGTLTLEKLQDKWVCREHFNFPVKFDQLSEMVVALSELKTGNVVNADESLKRELNMLIPPHERAGTVISIFDSNNEQLASLLFGALRMSSPNPATGAPPSPAGQHISLDAGKTVMLVGAPISYMRPAYDQWLDRDIMNLSSRDVARVEIRHPDDKKNILLIRDAKGALEMQGLSRKEELNPNTFRRVDSAFSRLELVDIADPSMTDEQLDLEDPIIFTIKTIKGHIYTAHVGGIADDKGGHYIRLSAKARRTDTAKADADVDAATKQALAQQQLDADILAFNEKVSPWTYVVNAYKTDSMTATREVLVRKKEDTKDKE